MTGLPAWALGLLWLALVCVLVEHAHRRRWRAVLCRACRGRAWRRAFPRDTKDDIRALLALVADAFVIAPRHRLKLHPDDRLLWLYRLNNPHRWTPDSLEFEALHDSILKHHGVDLQPLWHDGFTVGDLLRAISPTPHAG